MTFRFNAQRLRIPRLGRILHRKIVDSVGTIFEYDANVPVGLVLGFFGGLSSGLLGIGGESLMVPILHLTMGFPMHVTVATSMFIMIFTSTFGAATHFSLGNVHINYATFLCLGVIFGAQLGDYFSKRISGEGLRKMFGVVLLFVSLRMILRARLQKVAVLLARRLTSMKRGEDFRIWVLRFFTLVRWVYLGIPRLLLGMSLLKRHLIRIGPTQR
jgi:hypothetical protein